MASAQGTRTKLLDARKSEADHPEGRDMRGRHLDTRLPVKVHETAQHRS
ncbi:hypothetical protein [Streptomyces acidicola]